jgi:type IV secretory pathway VirB6-like protein
MITLYGWNMLIQVQKTDRKEQFYLLMKVVVVVSFSATTWWYSQVTIFTFGFSNTFSSIVAKIGFDPTMDAHGNLVRHDGCYFGDITNILAQETVDNIPNIGNNNYFSYPASRRYVAFFDSLDCKLAKYLGYGMGLDVPNLALMFALSFIWPFNIGLIMAVGTFLLFFFVLNFAFKAVYIFMASSIAISILLYLAPIFIPCILFKRTKGMFDKWVTNLIGYCLQPMILFAFVGMSLTVIDQYTIGEGIFKGEGINKELICGYSCVSPEKDPITGKYYILDYTNDRNDSGFISKCGDGAKIVDIKRNSVLCLINKISDHKNKLSTFLSIGLVLPFLYDFFTSDLISIMRVALLFYVLTQILESLPSIATVIVGGTALPGSTVKNLNPFDNARTLFGYAKDVKTMGQGTAKKARDWAVKKKDNIAKYAKEHKWFNKE